MTVLNSMVSEVKKEVLRWMRTAVYIFCPFHDILISCQPGDILLDCNWENYINHDITFPSHVYQPSQLVFSISPMSYG